MLWCCTDCTELLLCWWMLLGACMTTHPDSLQDAYVSNSLFGGRGRQKPAHHSPVNVVGMNYSSPSICQICGRPFLFCCCPSFFLLACNSSHSSGLACGRLTQAANGPQAQKVGPLCSFDHEENVTVDKTGKKETSSLPEGNATWNKAHVAVYGGLRPLCFGLHLPKKNVALGYVQGLYTFGNTLIRSVLGRCFSPN